ncbi:MAG: hypothetical protein A2330_08625 [Ignavibacteria bacterium RIFOXYB2_FULL_36_7]|nr:MAG: hypothetical protein A2330_08625 [Ignavibacteria bacterium RIFOXYB2_FULL_36_7]
MKISANAIGNYSPVYAKKPLQEQKPAENISLAKFQPQKTNGAAELTGAEKEFFAKLYPEDKAQIMDYHYYQRNGQMSGVKIGSMFDKRG